ncbi:putative dirigent protein [Helianthus debilis subsp. tardiflorus]
MTENFICLLLPLLIILRTFLATGEPDPMKYPYRIKKLSHFRFYWHNIFSGPNPTVVNIVPPLEHKNKTTWLFGKVDMIDDPLTETPEVGSRLLGRAQGLYAMASQEEIGMLMAMDFVFSTGKYNGSTLMILGRNPALEKVREMPVIGGSGLFRFARGYVEASTYSYDIKTGDAVVEYNVYVLHF